MNNSTASVSQILYSQHLRSASPSRILDNMSAIDENPEVIASPHDSVPTTGSRKQRKPRANTTHRSHFKHRYLVESAWRKGGLMTARHIHPDQGVVTSLHLTKKYIVVALDNAKIHVFNTRGDHQRTLLGHQMGVWAMVPWEDILVSGGCDRDVRVWNMATGYVEQKAMSDPMLTLYTGRAYTLYEVILPLFAVSRCRMPGLQFLAQEILRCECGT